MPKRFSRLHRRRAYAVALGVAVLSTAGIVLLNAPGMASTPGPASHDMLSFSGPGLRGRASFAHRAVLAHGTRRVAAEVRLTPDGAGAVARQPVALAVVLDVSGSMAGDKIEQARGAVLQLVERMRPGDQVAVVTYNHGAQLLVPLTSVASTRGELRSQITRIFAGGGTNIPAGIQLGVEALKDGTPGHVRRMVLVSDGLDNSGQPVQLVSSTIRQRAAGGVTLSSLGIGTDYDEGFLTSVADAGRGNYAFLAHGAELHAFLTRELDQATSTVVDQVVAELDLPPGWRLVGAHGTESQGVSGTVRLALGALPAGQDRVAVVELEVDAAGAGSIGAMGLRVQYRTVADDAQHRLEAGALALSAVPTDEEVGTSVIPEVHAATAATLLDAKQAEAVEAWRSGDRQRALEITRGNLQRLAEVEATAPAAAAAPIREQMQALEADSAAFDAVPAASPEGRAHGLRSNAARRARAW